MNQNNQKNNEISSEVEEKLDSSGDISTALGVQIPLGPLSFWFSTFFLNFFSRASIYTCLIAYPYKRVST